MAKEFLASIAPFAIVLAVRVGRSVPSWMGSAFAAIKPRPATDPVWSFAYMQLLTVFHAVMTRLGLNNKMFYQTRHSGASIDRMKKKRSSEGARRRGGWKNPKSVARYEKHARMVDSLASLPGGLRRHMDSVEIAIVDIVLRVRVVAIPSLVAVLAD